MSWWAPSGVSKIQLYLEGFRRQMNLPEWMRSLQCVAEGSEQGRARVEVMRQNLTRIVAAKEGK